MTRLAALSPLPGDVARPGYEPQAHGAGIVHLGLGAFHRAHQAVVTDDALAAAGGDWRIIGVSLRSRAVAEALNQQNGLYTLITRGEDATSARVIAAIARVIAADPAATLEALCAPATRIVTLTVTEKAYGIDRSHGGPDWSRPAHQADLARPVAPQSVLGLLTEALRRRRAAGVAPFTLLCCDNLPQNGRMLRQAVLGFAGRRDPALAAWIAEKVAFPSSMVDRITPAPTEATREEAARRLGCEDLAAVESEPFLQWVIEDDFPEGRPAWEAGGAIFVRDVTPYERMKLTMLNGSHSLLAYAGFLAGHRHVREVMADPALSALVARHIRAAAALLPALPGIDLADYGAALIRRFRNPNIAHETYQIAMDGTQKLPQRIFDPAQEALARGQPLDSFAFACAAWMAYLVGGEEGRHALRDPREGELLPLVAEARAESGGEAGRMAETLCRKIAALPGLVPASLAASGPWRDAVTLRLTRMLREGMTAAITAEAEGL